MSGPRRRPTFAVMVAVAIPLVGIAAVGSAQSPMGPSQPSQPSQPSRPQHPTDYPVDVDFARRARLQLTPDDLQHQHPVLRRPGEQDAIVRRDLVYRTVDGRPLRFDLYLPPGATKPVAGILFATIGSDGRAWASSEGYGRLAAAHGLAGIVYEKRFGRSQLLEGVSDTRALVEYLRARGAASGVDASRLMLWGFSLGGRLLATGIDPLLPEIRAMIGFYPSLDLSGELPFYPDSLRERLRVEASPDDRFEARPLALPPTLIVRAGLDEPMVNSGIARFLRIALEQNRSIELINLPRGRAGFDLIDDNEDSRRAMERAFEFAKEETGTP